MTDNFAFAAVIRRPGSGPVTMKLVTSTVEAADIQTAQAAPTELMKQWPGWILEDWRVWDVEAPKQAAVTSSQAPY